MLVGYGVKPGSAKRRERVSDALEPIGGEADAFPVLAKPPVRKLAQELGVEITTVTPSGPGGLVTREDVEQQAKVSTAKSLATYPADDQPWLESGYDAPDGRSTRVPVKSVRKRTAEAMVNSAFTAPHVTEFLTIDATATMELVAKLKTDRDFADVRVTPLLVVVKALLLAVRRHPEVNASWDEAAQEIVYKHYVNLGIAASTPRGLVVPNIKDAHRLPLHQLASGAHGDHDGRACGQGHAPRDVRRHHHHHQRWRARHRHRNPDPQPRRGRDPRVRRDPPAAVGARG